MRLGLEQAEALLKSREKRPGEVRQLVQKLEALAGPRVHVGGLAPKLKSILRRAETQKRFAEASAVASDTFDDAYAQLFNKK
mmetsp:Transcript_100883/g.179006  ORF Transcript_100883/g.179006 Transcript_100883/m.179006 type:complete len:82 (-) Transcript_100883:16-261(-)